MKQTSCESMDENAEIVSSPDQERTFTNASENKDNLWKPVPTTLLTKKENVDLQQDQENCNPCSSAKQYRKMQEVEVENKEEINLSYEWEQKINSVSLEIELKGKAHEQKVFDISFTSREALISLPEKTHVIRFHGLIKKEKSRVQMKKGKVILLVIKETPGHWPALETSVDPAIVTFSSHSRTIDKGGGDDQMNNEQIMNNCEEKTAKESLMGGDQKFMHGNHNQHELSPEDVGFEIVDKEEEPVYHLKDLKHEFFERGSVLTLQVFTKSIDKDAVKMVFNAQGFVLKFLTSDEKFLTLHEGTSSETTFSWTVTTRKEIVPEECKFKVRASGIEVSLQKISPENWISLEAPVRKEISEPSKSDAWLPIGASVQAALSNNIASSSSSSQSVAEAAIASSSVPLSASVSPVVSSSKSSGNKGRASNVMFDDLPIVNLRDTKNVTNLRYKDEDADTNLSLLSENLKPKSYSAQEWNKPTAKVQPLNKYTFESTSVVSPGYAGLVNLGNTCFMNCVLQVLSNSREFRDYFLDGRFHDEINEDNPLGMKGHLAATYGVLLQWLWSCKKHCWEPRKLKDLISKKNPQFFGYAQHDAHEFLAFLLDGLHEDLNRIKNKPYTETVDSNGRPDEVVAAEAWAQYKKRNDSVVVDLFQGQYKSKLVCPKCGKVSITFDPFLYLSVPLPKKKKRIPVTFMWKESYKRPVRYQILIPQESTVEFLKEELSQRTGVKTSDIRVFEAYKGRIHKMFLTGSSLSCVESKDIIIASEVLSEEVAGEEVLELPVMQRTLFPSEYPTRCAFCYKPCGEGTSLKRCTKCLKVGYCDHACQRNHWNQHKSQCSTSLEPIGCPFIVSLPASRATYSNLVKHMEGCSRFSVDIFQPPVKSTTESKSKPSNLSSSQTTNLTTSLSQSCSSLNSLDSLSSASSTCTLTGEQSDPQITEDRDTAEVTGPPVISETESLVSANPNLLPTITSTSSESKTSGDSTDSVKPANSGGTSFESNAAKAYDKPVPTSHVMGIPVKETDRDKATPTFFIRPVNTDGVSLKGEAGLEDKGDVPLELISHKFLSMDWRNSERLPSYVLVQSKELEAEEVEDLNNINNMSNKPSLYQCLELFTEPEVLNPEEAWYCPSCKKHVEASKQMAIWRLPHTLVIQLKRFSFQNFLMRSKITKIVDFPIRGLDLQRFCVGVDPNEPKPIYDLYGVANHHGLLIGGHYTSFVRCAGDGSSGIDEVGWRLCDDSRVTSIANEKSVVTADAYLLFYRRRGMSATIGYTPEDVLTGENHNSSNNNGQLESGASASRPATSVGYSTDFVTENVAGAVSGTSFPSAEEDVDDVSQSLNRNEAAVNAEDDTSIFTTDPAQNSSSSVSRVQAEDMDSKWVDYDQMDEKCDWEKAYDDLESEGDSVSDREGNLVIDTSRDLGYTDMEAVD